MAQHKYATTASLVWSAAGDTNKNSAIGSISNDALTYGELWNLIEEQAKILAGMHLVSGDIVAIVLPNGPELATTFLAVTCVATAAPLNDRFTKREFEYYITSLDAKAIIVSKNHSGSSSAVDAAKKLHVPIILLRTPENSRAGEFELIPPKSPDSSPLPQVRDTDIALVLHTSGTTSAPKIVPLTHSNLIHSAHNVATALDLQQDDICLNIMPLFHIHGVVAALLSTLYARASVVCTPGFQAPTFFEWFKHIRPTWYTAVPTMHQGILSRIKSENWSGYEGTG